MLVVPLPPTRFTLSPGNTTSDDTCPCSALGLWGLIGRPPILLTENELEEYIVQEIIDARRRGAGWQCLVLWVGCSPHWHDQQLSSTVLNVCEAPDRWFAARKGM